jgi:hypothetical protein
MKKIKFYIVLCLLGCLAPLSSCKANIRNVLPTQVMYLGSTPAHPYVKSLIGIKSASSPDFIKWTLVLNDEGGSTKTFILSLNFGESQPNTTNFIGGGEKRTIRGTYTLSSKGQGMFKATVFQLSSNQFAGSMSFIKVNENIIHLLTADNLLTVGGGDYSYSLNREIAVKSSQPLTSFVKTAFAAGDTSTMIILDARTACTEVATDNNLSVQAGCFKLKWKVILHRDPVTFQPTTYRIERTDKRTDPVTGKWTILEKDVTHPQAIIYRLDPTTKDFTIFLLVGDYNVLFMLDKNKQPYKGNELHSYTLNRRMKP